MIRYLAVRVALGLVAILGVTIITFIGERTAGSPVLLMVAPTATQAEIQAKTHQLGLDRPLPVQYAIFLGHAFRGDFGTSIKFDVPATHLVKERVGATVELAGTAFLLSLVVGVLLGTVAAAFRGTLVDRAASLLGLVGQAMPGFWVGIMLLLIFAVKLRWLPVGGRGGLSHLVLPAVTLSWFSIAAFLRLTRSAMLDVLDSDYVKLARLKGVPEWLVVGKHALRNTLVTVATYAGLTLATLLGGTVIVETIFSWPGIGSLLTSALYTHDYPVIQAGVVLVSFTFVACNLGVDLLYGALDPRIRHARTA